MIRRDYFMRMAQEFAQVLARLLSLKQKGEYRAATNSEKLSELISTLAAASALPLVRQHA